MIKLGSKVRDSITGLVGIAVGRTEWLYGCARIVLQPNALHDGKPIETSCFDEAQLEVVEEAKPYVNPQAAPGPGGPRPTPTRRADPKR